MRPCTGWLAGLILLSSVSFGSAAELPTLEFEASGSHRSTLARLQKMDRSRFRETMHLVGLVQAGEPIRVIVASDDSDWAQRAPIWASGYALTRFGIIVILPERVVGYPYDSLENVLSHEIAHIFTARASRGHVIPRWFDEGLAMVAAHSWDFADGARLTWALVTGNPISLEYLDTLFHKDRTSAKQAYVLSHAIVRYFINEFGRDWPKKMLAAMSQGVSFDQAFTRITFKPLKRAEAGFWANQTVWARWVPAVTSTIALWLGIVVLALYAFKKQRQRAKLLKRKWKEEEHSDS